MPNEIDSIQLMNLNYVTFPSDEKERQDLLGPLIIIPGLFGSTGNWRGFAKKLSTTYRVIVIDQRNHGDSPHAESNTYFDLATDIEKLLESLELTKATLIGHSMGGKTAMLLALLKPHLIDKLIILDIAPVAYGHSHLSILNGIDSISLEGATSRADIERQLANSIPDKATRMFIMLNLAGSAGNFRWKINVPVLKRFMDDIVDFPKYEVAGLSYERECLFVTGGRSDYVKEEDKQILLGLFPNAQINVVEEAGHWLHVEKPDAVIGHIKDFLEKE